MDQFNGLGMNLGNLSRISFAKSRSISPENMTGEAGKGGMATEGMGAMPGRDLGQGWKISPSLEIDSNDTLTLADIHGSGAIQQIWLACIGPKKRDLIFRMYWDDQSHPSVEVPLGDFFCCGLEDYAHVNSLPVCVNPGMAFNCFWEMPYRKNARITLENRDPLQKAVVYFQINYTETKVPKDCAYFHAQFRRTNPVPYKGLHTILDGVEGQGQYVGTYMTWGCNSNGWWGEGEVKFFMDEDQEFPTICGTGTEDYFLGSHNYDIGTAVPNRENAYTEYSTAYAGVPEVQRPDGVYRSQHRFGMYRWHIPDPIRFEKQLKVNVQALGWRDFGHWGGDV
ncbi:glycoside hydrolase family 172 protein [Parashewanella curva]|uniref:glycoside hydrolase family 172 protein n=1 Tax=Parashewanella curva TaxID=2338552 RepID=UPI001A9DE392|nr:glycoside hydrolase family 172 protein [Parashewanella curva]